MPAGLYYDRSQSTFTLADAQAITGLSSHLASSLLHKAVRRGLMSRLQPGLFVIVPPELGSATEYSGDPYLTARKLAGSAPCFLSHASAMEIHRMVTKPQLAVFASSANKDTQPNAPWDRVPVYLHPARGLFRDRQALGHEAGVC